MLWCAVPELESYGFICWRTWIFRSSWMHVHAHTHILSSALSHCLLHFFDGWLKKWLKGQLHGCQFSVRIRAWAQSRKFTASGCSTRLLQRMCRSHSKQQPGNLIRHPPNLSTLKSYPPSVIDVVLRTLAEPKQVLPTWCCWFGVILQFICSWIRFVGVVARSPLQICSLHAHRLHF